MLGAIASGLWILHPSYVTDSLKAGYWLQVLLDIWLATGSIFLLLKPSQLENYLNEFCVGKWFWFVIFQESKYEWGNPEPQFIDLTSGEISAKLAIAGKRRRLARERGEEKIFGGIQAHLVMPEKKVGPFKR